MSTTAVLKNYPFLDNYTFQNDNDYLDFKEKKIYQDKYSFDSLMQNIKDKRDILNKKQKINNLIFKGI
tara:strand:+ start:2433 stop:2636 length:204 start_codon:yes stop_codon:yes gene_type:complete